MTTPLQVKIIADLTANGSSTAKDLADRLGISTRSASNSLEFLRGDSVVNDGSVMYDWTSTKMCCVHRPEGPVVWALGSRIIVQGECPEK
jgi:DNA-binding Lrp family transcriptional regulator